MNNGRGQRAPREVGSAVMGIVYHNGLIACKDAKPSHCLLYTSARVEVVAHSYAAGDETEELLRSEPISGEAVMYTWDAPHYGYAIRCV